MSQHVRRASWTVGIQTAALVFACFLLAGLTVYLTVDSASSSRGWAEVRQTARSIDHPSEAPTGTLVVIDHGEHRAASAGLPAGAPVESDIASTRADGRERRRALVAGDDHYRVVTVRVHGRVVQALYDDEAYEAERRRLLSALSIAGGIGVILSALLGAVLARRTMRPMAETLALQQRFIADASHELRTPLTLLSTRAQLLARSLQAAGDASLRREADAVVRDTGRLADILDDMLVAADPRGGTPAATIDVASLGASAVNSAQATAAERGVALSFVSTGDARVLGSETSLHRALVALIDNALDHADSRVTVTTRVAAGHVLLEVADDGPGIDPKAMPRLFERFASARSAPVVGDRPQRRHYGLGLSLVAEIARAHGGRVDARNSANGAVLTVSLPIAR